MKDCFYNQLTAERFVSLFNWTNIERTMNVLPRTRGDVLAWVQEFMEGIKTEKERSDILKFITGSRIATFDQGIRVRKRLSLDESYSQIEY